MLEQSSPGKYVLDDGLQVASGSCVEEKYPAIQLDDPLYTTNIDSGRLCLVNVENTEDQINATPNLKVEHQPERQGRSPKRRSIYILPIIMLLAIVGACVGGVLGSRKHKTTPEQSSAAVPSTAPSVGPSVPQNPEVSTIYNGTSFAATAYPLGTDQIQYYVLYYQNTNGDIQKAVYNGSNGIWQKPLYVTNDARVGTGLATSWGLPTESDVKLWLYYIDKNDKLQELRGSHGNDTWIRGTLGNSAFEAANTYSALATNFLGKCDTGINAFLCYQTADGTVRQVLWNSKVDTWVPGPNFTDVKPHSGFVTYQESSAWRIFMMNRDSQVIQYDCFSCCVSVQWEQGVSYTFPTTVGEPSGIGAINIQYIRLHYQSDDGIIRVLNYSGAQVPDYAVGIDLNYSGDPGKETFEASALTLGKAMMGTKMAIADGSVWDQPIKAFYQTNGSDITVTTWLTDAQHFQSTVQLPLSP